MRSAREETIVHAPNFVPLRISEQSESSAGSPFFGDPSVHLTVSRAAASRRVERCARLNWNAADAAVSNRRLAVSAFSASVSACQRNQPSDHCILLHAFPHPPLEPAPSQRID